MKKFLLIGLIIFLTGSFFSCSVSFEKRRYRPGYHVNITKKHPREHWELKNSDPFVVDQVNEKPKHLNIPTRDNEIKNIKTIPQVMSPNGISISKNVEVDQLDNSTRLRTMYTPTNKNVKKILETKKAQSMRGKRTKAWVLGGFSMGFALGSIPAFFTPFVGFIIGPIILGIGLVLAIIALIVRYSKPKDDKEDPPYKPISTGYINGSFIFSIVTLSLALIGCIFSFFIYPFGFISLGISITAIIAAIISFSLGFRALKDDKSLKTKLIVIFGFMALLLAAVAILLLFF